MAISTAESYFDLLQKSRLLDQGQLAQARDEAARASDAVTLARALVDQGMLTLWQAEKLLAGRTAFFLGKYKLMNLLGAGGMGRVFVAEHTTMNRPVALKIISRQLGQDPASLERFFTEARAIAALNHPNIVHAYDVDREADRYYLVMEFIEGQDLQRMVEAQGPLECDRAVDYIRQAADGLAHAHSRDMIHCDVKPANLLVNQQGVVKILDLGVARLVQRSQEAAAGNEERPAGTADYMAPEQAMGAADLDHRADLYSLGCSLYFLLTGRAPFPEGTLPERILKHQTAQPRKISELRDDVPADIVTICERMMAKRPEDRFQSADQLSQVLAERSLSDDDVPMVILESPFASDAAHTEGDRSKTARLAAALTASVARARALIKGRPRLVLAGLGGVAALAVLVVVIVLLSRSGEQPGDAAGTHAAAGEGSPGAQKQTPEKTPSKPDASDQEEADKEGEKDDNEWRQLPDFGNLRDFDPEAFDDDGKGKAAPSGAKPKPKEGASGKAAPQKPDSGKPQPEKPVPEKREPDEPNEKPKEKIKSQPKPESTSPEKGPPAKSQPEKPETKKPKPEKPKPEKPQTRDPLRELPEMIDLPELPAKRASDDDTAPPVLLGRVHSEPDVPWQIDLLGGQTAFKRSRSFVLRRDESDKAKASWLVELETASASSDPTREPVARLWRDRDALMFQWAEDAAASSANYLRNCVLQARVEGKSKQVVLTSSKAAEPIPIDLDRGSVNTAVPVKWLPNAGNLRVVITGVEGWDDHTVNPEEPADPKQPFELRFTRTDRNGNTADMVGLRLLFTPRPAAMQVRLQVVEPPPAFFKEVKARLAQRNPMENYRDSLLNQLNPKDKTKAPKGEKRAAMLAEIAKTEGNMWYIDFYNGVQDTAKIHFRIFNEVDGRQVVLASTEL